MYSNLLYKFAEGFGNVYCYYINAASLSTFTICTLLWIKAKLVQCFFFKYIILSTVYQADASTWPNHHYEFSEVPVSGQINNKKIMNQFVYNLKIGGPLNVHILFSQY